ncbi:MAG: GAF domain-containing SpoIIE family protein phosphatase [Acidimicrobiales bacterium]
MVDTPREPVFEELARVVARLLRAPYAFVTIVDDLRSFWKAAHGVNDGTRSNDVEESFCQYVIRARDDLLVDDARVNPLTHDNPSIEKMGVQAWAGAPIMIDDQVVGSFCVVDIVPRQWTDADREILHVFRDQVEREFEHRRLLQAQQSAHRADSQSLAELRAELVPAELPDVPGVEIATWHRAASDGNDVLGDFYDAFPVDDNRWGVVLGDVCGHGAAAARLTALVRYTLRAAVTHASDPAGALRELNVAIVNDNTDPGRFATLSYLEIDAARPGAIRRASAGHPPPLMLPPGGAPTWLAGANSPPVGLTAVSNYDDETVTLEPGAIVLLYTDGVTDARNSAGDALGEDRLQELAAAAPRHTAHHFVDHIAREILAHTADNLLDDIALLAVKFLPVP